MSIRVEALPLDGACVLHRAVHRDARGWFTELWRDDALRAAGIDAGFVQDNWARSQRGVLRGLHVQAERPQGKLLFVVRGAVQDAMVDVRAGSPTYGRSVTLELDESDGRAVWIPPGMAHGYCVLSDWADVVYKCTTYYEPSQARGFRYDDPAFGIRWKVDHPTLSDDDRAWPPFDAGARR